jgi:hypothetical protein
LIVLRIVLFAAGAAVVLRVLRSALVTFVVPRAVTDTLVRWLFLRMRTLFRMRERFTHSYEEQDAMWALFAPLTLFCIPLLWVFLVLLGYAAMFWAVGVDGWQQAITISGSSLLTLGFAVPATFGQTLLAFSEAVIGLGLIAILLAYLPTIYSSWSRREALVSMLAVRAGSPPTPLELFRRYHLLQRMDKLGDLWVQWETWFVDIEESHSSLAPLALFRSARADRSWVVAAGCVLDAASIFLSSIDLPRDPQAAIVIRSGSLALRNLCTLFRLPFAADPHFPATPIAVTRAEFDEVFDALTATGLPMIADRERAWLDFAGWRVNYDDTLRALAGLTIPPPAPWSSDRAIRYGHIRRG